MGGGLSGLCTGQGLASRHAGKTFVITEARDRVGGNITTVEGDVEGKHYLWEEGPNSFQPNDSMLQIAVEAGETRLHIIPPTFSFLRQRHILHYFVALSYLAVAMRRAQALLSQLDTQ